MKPALHAVLKYLQSFVRVTVSCIRYQQTSCLSTCTVHLPTDITENSLQNYSPYKYKYKQCRSSAAWRPASFPEGTDSIPSESILVFVVDKVAQEHFFSPSSLVFFMRIIPPVPPFH